MIQVRMDREPLTVAITKVKRRAKELFASPKVLLETLSSMKKRPGKVYTIR